MPKRKTTSGTQIMLAMIMFLTMISGFAFVYAIDYYNDGTIQGEMLFKTDNNIEFIKWSINDSTPPNHYDLQTSYYYEDIGAGYYDQWNKTPVYNGNNTWLVNCNGTNAIGVASALNTGISMPNLRNWLIDNISIKFNIDTPDNDININSVFLFSNNKIMDYDLDYQERQELIYNNAHSTFQTSFPDGWYNQTINIPLHQAMNIRDLALEKTDSALSFAIGDKDIDGLSAFTVNFNIEIWGKQISEISTVNALTYSLGGSAILGFICAVYMLDQFDIGGTFKDLPRMKRSNPKSKPKRKTKKKSGRRK